MQGHRKFTSHALCFRELVEEVPGKVKVQTRKRKAQEIELLPEEKGEEIYRIKVEKVPD